MLCQSVSLNFAQLAPEVTRLQTSKAFLGIVRSVLWPLQTVMKHTEQTELKMCLIHGENACCSMTSQDLWVVLAAFQDVKSQLPVFPVCNRLCVGVRQTACTEN